MTAPRRYAGFRRRLAPRVMKTMIVVNNFAYRRTGGRLGGRFAGAPVCLLTTVGRVTGTPRTVPLLYLADGDDVVVVASKGGWPEHPHWYANLVAEPAVDVQIGRDTRRMVARTATPEEKAALWPRLVRMYKTYDSYQARTDRDIPVVICSPAEERGT